jgi:hypothetical protein
MNSQTFSETATLISQPHPLILVVTVVAHLTGALAKPIHVFLARVFDRRGNLPATTTVGFRLRLAPAGRKRRPGRTLSGESHWEKAVGRTFLGTSYCARSIGAV